MSYNWEWLFETWGIEANETRPISDIEINRVEADDVTTHRDSWYTDKDHSALLKLTVSYPVTTNQAPATVSVWSDGDVETAFGGTGMREGEVIAYVEQAVTIYRAMTGDKDTAFRLPSHKHDAAGDRIDA